MKTAERQSSRSEHVSALRLLEKGLHLRPDLWLRTANLVQVVAPPSWIQFQRFEKYVPGKAAVLRAQRSPIPVAFRLGDAIVEVHEDDRLGNRDASCANFAGLSNAGPSDRSAACFAGLFRKTT
jgi:hypothetical protein